MRSETPSWVWLVLIAAVVVPALWYAKGQMDQATQSAEATRAETEATMDYIEKRSQR